MLDSFLIISPFSQVANNYRYQHPLQMALELEEFLITLHTGRQIVGNVESELQALLSS